jgi:hypothetical protein
MNDSTLSMRVFAIYLALLSMLLIAYPKAFLWLGFTDVSGPFVPTLGYVLGALAFFYWMAIRDRAKNFYRWTALARVPLLLFFAVLFALDRVPPIMLAIGAWDTACALWTGYALRQEARSTTPLPAS